MDNNVTIFSFPTTFDVGMYANCFQKNMIYRNIREVIG